MLVKNPQEKLDQLRRSSLLEFEHLKSPNHPKAPLRELPEHSVPEEGPLPSDDKTAAQSSSEKASTEPPPPSGYFALVDDRNKPESIAGTPADMPVFQAPQFGADGTSDGKPEQRGSYDENTISPTQTRT